MASQRRFVRKSYELLENSGYIGLSSDAKVLYDYAVKNAWSKKGNNPHRFKFGFSDIPAGVMSKSRFYRARENLVQKYFIEVMSAGTWPHRKAIFGLSKEWVGVFNERLE